MPNPDAVLAAQLKIAQRIINRGKEAAVTPDHDAIKLAELVVELHTWIRNGGFLPETWDKKRTVLKGTMG